MSGKTDTTRERLAQALYDNLMRETWCNENPDSLRSVWVDGDVDFYLLADAAIAAMGNKHEQE